MTTTEAGPRHPTTRLAARLLHEVAAGQTVLDVGCGSGALAAAAVAAGAATVVGLDHDPACVAAARVAVPAAEFVVADAADWLRARRGHMWDVVVANLPDPPLLDLIPLLAAAARHLVLSGSRDERALVAAAGRPIRVVSEAGWVALLSAGRSWERGPRPARGWGRGC